MTNEDIDFWNKTLYRNNLKSIVPVEDYFSSDLTEAAIMIGFWRREGLIVSLEEHELINKVYKEEK